MFRRLRHIIPGLLLLFAAMQTTAQHSMPDTVCAGTVRVYSVNDPSVPSTYIWKIDGVTQTAATNSITITWGVPGTFLLTVQEISAAGCYGDVQSGSVYVKPRSSSSMNLTICSDQLPYTWNGITIPSAGTYNATLVNSAGCDSVATLNLAVNPSPVLVINQPPAVCEPVTVDLTAPSITTGSSPGLILTYWLDSLATIPLLNPNNVSSSGTYYIKAASAVNNCTSTKPVAVNVLIYKLVPGIRYATISAIANTSTQLTARNIGLSYNWTPPVGLNSAIIQNPVFNYDRQTEYIIQITRDNGCITLDTLLVKVNAAPAPIIKSDLFVPKGWTPNNDGHNDKLFPLTVNIRELKYFRIFNRWGQLVYETNTIGEGWNGIFNGKPQVMDVFTWIAEAVGIDGKVIKKSGNSVLIR